MIGWLNILFCSFFGFATHQGHCSLTAHTRTTKREKTTLWREAKFFQFFFSSHYLSKKSKREPSRFCFIWRFHRYEWVKRNQLSRTTASPTTTIRRFRKKYGKDESSCILYSWQKCNKYKKCFRNFNKPKFPTRQSFKNKPP